MRGWIGLVSSASIVGVLAVAPSARAQDASETSWFVRGGLSQARILPVSPFEMDAPVAPDPIEWIPDLTVEVGWQTDGREDWHYRYGLPSYGVGFSMARFQNSAGTGRPLEAYTFFSWPFATLTDRLAVTTDFGMGLSWNWQQVAPRTAAGSAVLGSDLNARIDWGFYLRYTSTSRVSVFGGVDYIHRSNGGVVQPNKGLNVVGPKVNLQYRFGPEISRHSVTPRPPPPFHRSWQLLVGAAGGVKNVVEQTSTVARQDFGVLHANAELQHQFYRYGRIEGGTDVTYDGATSAKAAIVDGAAVWSRADFRDRWAVGAYGGYEHLIARFSVFAHLGYNVVRGRVDASGFPQFYQRFGCRYQVTDHLWTTMAIRSVEGNHADFLEFGAGYRIPFSD